MEIPYWLDTDNDSCEFPDPAKALSEPNGLLAVGGKLSPDCLLKAYSLGIFPWYNEDQPILWWSPNPRAVLFPADLKISRSLEKTLKKNIYSVTIDTEFEAVIKYCGLTRKDTEGTWITDQMIMAYTELHKLGYAHSFETWHQHELVGGLYGIALGKVFFGESMFHKRTDASKVAFVTLVRQLQERGFKVIDCQVGSSYLTQLGAIDISREKFTTLLKDCCHINPVANSWKTAQINPDQPLLTTQQALDK